MLGDKESQARAAIAWPGSGVYGSSMRRLLRSRLAKRMSAMILSFSVAMLALSVSGMGVRHAFSDTLHVKAVLGTGAPAAPAHPCDQCGGGDHDMSAAACSAACAGALAVLPAPGSLPVPVILRMAALPVVSSLASHNDPPDPYPPRPAIVS